MDRRTFLTLAATAVGATSLTGCLGNSPAGEDGDAATPTATQTPTPDPFPASCQALPDVEGVPSPPAEATEDSVREYVTEFERTYAVATNADYRSVESVNVNRVETEDDTYEVELAVEGVPATSTAASEGSTATPRPADATAHRALYRFDGDRLVRELRGYAGGRELSSDCWTVSESSA